MSRSLLILALTGMTVLGCTKKTDTATQDTSKPATALPSTPPPPQPSRPVDSDAQQPAKDASDVTGAYFSVGVLSDDFAEIEFLALANIDENAKPSPLNGFMRTRRKSAKDYKLVNPTLQGKILTFTTDAVDGISYSFTGAFEKLDNFPMNPPPAEEVVLKGMLMKKKDGNILAETKVDYTYSAGG